MANSISEAESEKAPEKRRLNFLARQQKALSQRDVLGLLVLGTLGAQALVLVFQILQYGAYSRLANKPPPSLVQLSDGKAINVAPLDSKERTPAVVKEFASGVLTLMMTWTGKLPAASVEEAATPKLDSGVEIKSLTGRRGKVTTASWQASFALSEDYRKEFLSKLAVLTPSGVFRGNTEVSLVILEIQNPEKIGDGQWKVKIVANLMIFENNDALGQVIPFNKEIFVKAVEPPKYPAQIAGIAKIIYGIRSSGLEIYGMRDLLQENLK